MHPSFSNNSFLLDPMFSTQRGERVSSSVLTGAARTQDPPGASPTFQGRELLLGFQIELGEDGPGHQAAGPQGRLDGVV